MERYGRGFRSSRATWLTSTVNRLADAIYADRRFDHMPILGDGRRLLEPGNPGPLPRPRAACERLLGDRRPLEHAIGGVRRWLPW